MALGYVIGLRNNQLDEITALIDADASAGEIRLYDGTRPATGGAVTTLVSTLVLSVTSAGAASGATLVITPPSDDTSAVGGTTTWFRVVDGAAVFVMDGDVGTGGSDLNLNTTVITVGVNVEITQFDIGAGNA